MVVTFFGHRDTPANAEKLLEKVLIDLIENHSADTFYVGNQGSFDYMVKQILKRLKMKYKINYTVVLAYKPKNQYIVVGDTDAIYPKFLENTHPKYAIFKRNMAMLKKADVVVTYVERTFGGANKFKELAQVMGKQVINLSDLKSV